MDQIKLRDVLLATGVASVLSARHFLRKRQTIPFKASVFLAWPTLGVGIMHAVIDWSTPKNIEMLSQQEAATSSTSASSTSTPAPAVAAAAAAAATPTSTPMPGGSNEEQLAARLRHLAQKSQH